MRFFGANQRVKRIARQILYQTQRHGRKGRYLWIIAERAIVADGRRRARLAARAIASSTGSLSGIRKLNAGGATNAMMIEHGYWIVKVGNRYLVANAYPGGRALRWSVSRWDAAPIRNADDARRLAAIVGGDYERFNPVTGVRQ